MFARVYAIGWLAMREERPEQDYFAGCIGRMVGRYPNMTCQACSLRLVDPNSFTESLDLTAKRHPRALNGHGIPSHQLPAGQGVISSGTRASRPPSQTPQPRPSANSSAPRPHRRGHPTTNPSYYDCQARNMEAVVSQQTPTGPSHEAHSLTRVMRFPQPTASTLAAGYAMCQSGVVGVHWAASGVAAQRLTRRPAQLRACASACRCRSCMASRECGFCLLCPVILLFLRAMSLRCWYDCS